MTQAQEKTARAIVDKINSAQGYDLPTAYGGIELTENLESDARIFVSTQPAQRYKTFHGVFQHKIDVWLEIASKIEGVDSFNYFEETSKALENILFNLDEMEQTLQSFGVFPKTYAVESGAVGYGKNSFGTKYTIEFKATV